MSRKLSVGLIVCSGAALVGAMVGMGQPEEQTDPAGDAMQQMMEMDPADMVAMMQEMSKPGEQHKLIEQMAGEWDLVAKFWMAPGAEPEVSKGTTSSKMVLGGRQLLSEVKMDFKFMGQTIPFEGVGIMGYDTQKNEFVSVWSDTMTTGQSTQKGSAEGNVITMEGMIESPMGESEMRQVYTVKNADAYTLEFYEPAGMTGEMVRTGLLEYTRKGKSKG